MVRKVRKYYEIIYTEKVFTFICFNTIIRVAPFQALIFSAILLFNLTQLNAQSRLEKWQQKRNKFFAVPLISYTPETNWSFGFTSQYLIRFKNDSVSNPSITGFTFLYTLNKQYIVNPNWDFFFLKNKYRATGAFVFQRYPDSFYGIGNNTSENNRERFSSDFLLLKQRLVRQWKKGLYVGIQYRFEKTYNVQTLAGGIFETENILGRNGYTASGAGAAIIYDTRDNVLFPLKGYYATLSNHFYPTWMGTTYPITNINIDARHYWNFYGSHVLASNLYSNFNFGDTPFKMMAQLGGQNLMRGYFQGRYRENNMMIGQLEYRFPIYWRFIGVAFMGVGDVYNTFNDWSFNRLKVAGGGGLRFTIDAKERVNLRFDYAWGRFNSRGFYLSITEAF